MNLSIHEKFAKILLVKDEWEYYNGLYFHKYYPDFTFKISEENYNNTYLPTPYSYEQYDKNQNTHLLEIFFRNMKIDEYRVDYLDGSRLSFVYPNTEYISKSQIDSHEVYSYLYFIKNDIRFKINSLFLDLTDYDHKYIFDNEEQKVLYDKYLSKNIEEILKRSREIIKNYSYIEVDNGLIKEKIIEDICQKEIITKIYNNISSQTF